jgi:hypothetical protein
MYRFIKNCFLFSFFILSTFIAFFFGFLAILNFPYKDLPDPAISGSSYFNEKLAILRSRPADIIGIGSSVTDNNLDSKTIINEFGTKSFFNLGAGGLVNKSMYETISIYNTVHKIKKIFIIGAFNDYCYDGFHPDYLRLRNFLTRALYNQYSLETLNKNYFYSIKNCNKIMKDTSSDIERPKVYTDFYGTEVLKKFVINADLRKKNKQRFDDNCKFFLDHQNLLAYNLSYLDSISLFCKKNDIELYYIQSPINETYLAGRKDLKESLAVLADKENKIIAGKGQHFIKSCDTNWPDSLFADYQHLNEVGAAFFTKDFLKKCKNN